MLTITFLANISKLVRQSSVPWRSGRSFVWSARGDRNIAFLIALSILAAACGKSESGSEGHGESGSAGEAGSPGGSTNAGGSGGRGGSVATGGAVATGGVGGSSAGGSPAGGSGAFETGGSAGDAGGTGNAGSAGEAGTGGQPCSDDGVLVEANGTAFCIDATEVTSAAYDAFLASGLRADSMPGCEWNDELEPLEVTGGGIPVRVDHCDAQAYCAWAGKRLCGRVGGGFIRAGTADFTTTESEWFYVCSAGGTQRYPYGDDLTQGACIDQSLGRSEPAPVGTASDCEGGLAGVHDLAGNVAEWTDVCNPPAGGANDLCPVRGGDFTVNVACDSWEAASRSSRGFGIRCCSDPR